GFGPPRVVSEGSYRRPGVTMNANALPRCVALLALVALFGCRPGPPDDTVDDGPQVGADDQEVACHIPPRLSGPVTISVVPDGDSAVVAVNRQPVLVCAGQRLEWLSNATVASWEVVFRPDSTPFAFDTVRSNAGGVGGGQANNLGAFKYDIVAVTPAGERIPLDPDAVIVPGLPIR
ncbi:MAG: hypothetical protein ABFS34_14870, partial [Gemmatimonadota bacterium]